MHSIPVYPARRSNTREAGIVLFICEFICELMNEGLHVRPKYGNHGRELLQRPAQ